MSEKIVFVTRAQKAAARLRLALDRADGIQSDPAWEKMANPKRVARRRAKPQADPRPAAPTAESAPTVTEPLDVADGLGIGHIEAPGAEATERRAR